MSTNFPEHASLLQLESSVLADIRSYGECTGELARQPQRLEASIQTKLSQIRALTRDLELLVEELDRYGVVINQHQLQKHTKQSYVYGIWHKLCLILFF